MSCLTDNNSCWKSGFVLGSINHMVRIGPPICICGDVHSLNSLKEQSFDVAGHLLALAGSCCAKFRGETTEF